MASEVEWWDGKSISAFIADENERPVFYLFGKQAKMGDFASIKSQSGSPVFDKDMVSLLNYVYFRGEITLDMEFYIPENRVYPAGKFWNSQVNVRWEGSGGKQRTASIKPFSVMDGGSFIMANCPQWKMPNDKGGYDYRPIVGGKLVETLKCMVEAQYRIGAESIGRRIPEPVHNGFCTRCAWYRSEGYERDAYEDNEGISISCALNKFVPFNTNDITVEMRERCGVTEDWKSMHADANWFWVTPEEHKADRALTFGDWMSIGDVIDNDNHPHHRGFYHRFTNFERYYDDTMWIDRIAESGFEGITDLDAAIEERRDKVLKFAARRWAERLPEYAHLFLQTSGKNMEDITPEEVGEKAHKISIGAFLNTNILAPCACGVQYRADSNGSYKAYRYQGYEHRNEPAPVFSKFTKEVDD